MSELIISVSGLRGIIGETLTPEVACRYAAAYATRLSGDGPIIIGRDGRTSGPMLRSAILAGLTASGRDVIDADVAATPTIGVLVQQHGAAGGVQISASHNPPEYNGIKLFGPTGRVLDAVSGASVRDAMIDGKAQWCEVARIGSVAAESDPHVGHLNKVLATIDVDSVVARRHRVLIDSNHGAGGLLGVRLLEALGCDVVAVGETPDGAFAHVPEPTAENLKGIAARVREENCVAGFCQDPDADRLALIDADGRYIGEEFTLALCVQRALSRPETCGPIVTNGATSGMSGRLAAAAGVESFRSAVGEANVADMMIANRATYGGEGNGGPIDPRVGYVRDSFVAMAQVLDLMTSTGKTLAALADALPQLHIHKDKATIASDRLPDLLNKLQERFPDASAQTGDGLRLAWADKWLLVRGSNTEPIVRFIAEAESTAEASELCRVAAELASA